MELVYICSDYPEIAFSGQSSSKDQNNEQPFDKMGHTDVLPPVADCAHVILRVFLRAGPFGSCVAPSLFKVCKSKLQDAVQRSDRPISDRIKGTCIFGSSILQSCNA